MAENSAQFFVVIFRGGDGVKKCTIFCPYLLWWGMVFNFMKFFSVDGPVIRA